MKRVRTRYAPSPTGYLHIGGARTALFAFLYAKHFGGEFIIRIEDTDISRNVKGGEESQLENLEWLGIIPDESPKKPNPKFGAYRQSEKLERYNELIERLIKEGKAYRAYDSSEELEMQRSEQEADGIASFRYDKKWLKISEEEKERRKKSNEYSVRIALRKNTNYHWKDIVRGDISVNTNDIGDFVIKKNNGYPTYNFAVVVDDHDMEISHVHRGEEHITNTPKQMAIYDALGWKPPQFGHFTIITNMEGKKLSKRDNSVKQFIADYKNEGYHSHAIFNFLVLLGWTHKESREILSKKELIRDFEPERLSKSSSKFDIKKMEWFSKEYIKNMNNADIIKKINLTHTNSEWVELFVNTYKQNAVTFHDIERAEGIYNNNNSKSYESNEVVDTFACELNNVNFSPDGIVQAINKTKEITGAKGKKLFMPIRQATTYQDHGPELAKAIFLFGEKTIKERLSNDN